MKGSVEAANSQQAEDMLLEMNLELQSLEKDTKQESKNPVGRSELLLFNQQLSAMAASGVPLEKGIRHISNEASFGSTKKLLQNIADDLENGIPADQAFDKHSKYFPVLYGKIVKAGIQSGRLNEMLISLNKHLVTSIQMRQSLIEAITYPLVVFLVAVAVLTWIFTSVVPSFRGLYAEWMAMPPITELLFKLSAVFQYLWIVILIVMIAIVLLVKFGSSVPSLQRRLESVYNGLPIIGRMYRSSALSKLADSLALLIASGSDFPDALELAAETTGRERLSFECHTIAHRVRQGENIIEASSDCKELPGIFMYSAQLGIQRNMLTDNLYNISDMFYQQAKVASVRLSALLTPILIVLLGLSISGVVVGLFLPMVAMIEDLG